MGGIYIYKKIEPPNRMTRYDASERYSNDFIIMRMDSMSLTEDTGTVLYVGDDRSEMFSLVTSLKLPYCGVIEGLNHQRSLGGVVVGG